jgi:hypothetical protein
MSIWKRAAVREIQLQVQFSFYELRPLPSHAAWRCRDPQNAKYMMYV